MTQQEFNQLATRYLEGKTTPDEDKLLLDWHKAQAMPRTSGITPTEKRVIERRIWRNISRQLNLPFRLQRWTSPWVWAAGLAACLLLGFFWLMPSARPYAGLSLTRQVFSTRQVGIEMKNTTLTEQRIQLSDGTIVLLQRNSSLVCDKSFNTTRRVVYLQGEAFFSVKRNESKPFLVHVGALVTEVLGTSFRVKPNANTVEVAVTSGKVSVYTKQLNPARQRNGVILTPNQRVIYDVESQNLVQSLVDEPVPLHTPSAGKQALVFRMAPLQTVLTTLSAQYGIEFVIANPKIKECQITADLSDLPLFTQLELICKSIDASYEKRGTVVFIEGDGC